MHASQRVICRAHTGRAEPIAFATRLAALGLLLAAVVLTATARPQPAQAAPPIEVTNILDSGAGSLRWAIQMANIDPLTADTIVFDIPGGGDFKQIVVGSPLPPITGPVIIDGYCGTCSGATPNTNALHEPSNAKIAITLIGDAAGGVGLDIISPGVTIQGLSVAGFPDPGIRIAPTATGAVIRGNHIGVAASGQFPFGNEAGIVVRANGVLIGGEDPAARNVIAANLLSGVDASGSTNLRVLGNYIGVSANGTSALGNGVAGIALSGVHNAYIGDGPGAGNVVSGNGFLFQAGPGVRIENSTNIQVANNLVGTDRTGNVALGNAGSGVMTWGVVDHIEIAANTLSGNGYFGAYLGSNAASSTIVFRANRVGTNANGNSALPNAEGGIRVEGVNGAVIGGPDEGDGNLISGNMGPGIELAGNVNGAIIQRNTIGLGFTGGPLGNFGPGIRFEGPDAPTSALVGGPSIEFANIIASNEGAAIEVVDGVALRLSSNLLYGNTGLAIDLGANGVTPNDPGDPDVGPNDLLNWPEVTRAKRTSLAMSVEYRVDAAPAQALNIQFFSGDSCGETRNYLGTVSINSGNGTADFAASTKLAPTGKFVTAVAIDAAGNTSETGACAEVEPREGADVNCDDTVDAADVMAALRQLAGHTDAPLPQVCLVDPATPSADANGDGVESIADVVRIRRVAAGLE